MNSRFRPLRIATLCSIFLALIFMGVLAALSPQASIAERGSTARALAIGEALHPARGKGGVAQTLRFPYVQDARPAFIRGHAAAKAVNPPITISEAVQTFDVFAPGPSFLPVPPGPLNATNLRPEWTSDEGYIVFSSNRVDPNGQYHLWAVSSNGGTPVQLTSGTGNEYDPVLSPTNKLIAFTSDAQTQGVQNLYVAPFSPTPAAPVDVATLTSPTIRQSKASDISGFSDVGRPAWAPAEDRLAFAALTNVGGDAGHFHIYYLNTTTFGYLAQNGAGPNPPGKITAGPEDDSDAAWSPDGKYILFTSNAAEFHNTGNPIFPSPTDPALQTTPVAAGSATSFTSLFAIDGSAGTVPASLAASNAMLTPGPNDGGGAWSDNSSSKPGYVAFHRQIADQNGDGGVHFQIYYWQAENLATGNLTPFSDFNGAVLNTSNTSNSNDLYPAWSRLLKHAALTYQSNRSVTYNDANNKPLETALTLVPGTGIVGPDYSGILESAIVYVNPPKMIPYTHDEVIHVNTGTAYTPPTAADPTGGATHFVPPGTMATFTVRLSDRESGLDDNNIYLQFKDPDSLYQDTRIGGAPLEHKVFTGNDGTTSGSADIYLDNLFAGPYGVVGNNHINLLGAIGTAFDSNTFVGVGHINLGANDGGDNIIGGSKVPGYDIANFTPWGQEYECQYLNANYYAGNAAQADPTVGQYGSPFYLAGVDDQAAGTAPTPRREWLKLTRLPDAQQDANGGVLYSTVTPAGWKVPASPSDYYIDVIAYDNAQNWRIFDNAWGVTSQQFTGHTGILVVSDYALGQKFLSSSIADAGVSNVAPTFYGAESYFTDVDTSRLPNAVTIATGLKGYPPVPTGVIATVGASPNMLAAYPSYDAGDSATDVVLRWGAPTPLPTTYTITRTTSPNGPTQTLTQVLPGTATRFVDRSILGGDPKPATTYVYNVIPVGNNGAAATVTLAVPAPTDLKFAGMEVLPLGGPRLVSDNPLQEQPRTFPAAKNALGESSFGAAPMAAQPNGYPYFNIPFYREIGYTPDATPDAGHQYDIWRILSRGPLPSTILASYSSALTHQVAVNDNYLTPPTKDPAADIPNSSKCVVWVSPYAGEVVSGPGTILDRTTQTQLQAFVAGGGRLFISGAHIADALTFGGSVNTAASDFVASFLGATWTGRSIGSQNLTPLGARGNRLSFDPYFNQNLALGVATPYYTYTTDDNLPYQYTPPSARPTILANDLASPENLGDRSRARTDGSLDQFGPYSRSLGAPNRDIVGYVDRVNPVTNPTGSHNDMTSAGGAELIYNEYPGGGKVVYAPFGFEALGIDYYRVTKNGSDYYLPYNLRPNLVHNIVTYLRTGAFTGIVTDDQGAPVGGATVYLVPNEGVPIPGLPATRTVYSATDLSAPNTGAYTIYGVEQGAYTLVAYKTGYARGVSNHATSVDALGVTTISIAISKIKDGTISGHVTYADGHNANGASVSFLAPDGTQVSAVTSADGFYSIQATSAADPGLTYTGGIAQKDGVKTDPAVSVVVASNKTVTADFVLPPAPSYIKGTVTDAANGNPIGGATVAFTVTGGTTVAGTTTTGADGKYTSPNLKAGTYDVTATLAPAYLIGAAPGVTLLEGDTVTQDFALQKAAPGSITGVVKYADHTVVAGATVTFTPQGGGAPLTTTTAADGSYSIASAPSATEPGQVYNATAVKNHSSAAAVTTVASGAATVQNFTLPIPPGNFIGHVKDSVTGVALPGATVTFTKGSSTPITVTTDAQGAYDSGNLLAGTYTITASLMPNYQTTTLTGIVLARDATVTEEITLKPVQPGTINGVVSSPSGLPVPGATVSFAASGQTALTAQTDANGTYTITPVATVTDPGTQYVGTASKGGVTSSPATVTVTDNKTVTQNFTLSPPPGTFSGTVTDAASGLPLGGALVVFTPLQGADKTPSSATTAGDGTYTSPALAFGNYTVTASLSPKYFPQTFTPVYLADSVKTTQNFQLAKEPNGEIGGLVALSQGTLVGGATITITPGDGSSVITSSSNATATATPNGSINYVANVSPGTYTVTLTKAGYTSSSSVTVTVTTGGFQRADLVFSPIATIPAGIRMISAPYDYSSIDDVLGVGKPAGTVRIAIWQPTLLAYVLNPTAPADGLHLGYGYWTRLATASDIYFTGAAPTSATVSVPLHKYWNQIGVPSTSSINVSDLKFTSATGATLTFDQASSPSVDIVDKTLYSYDPGSNSYQPVTAGGTLSPWQGYWIKVLKDTTIMIPTNATAAHAAAARSQVSRR